MRLVAPVGDVVRRPVQRVGDCRFFDHAVILGVANVPVHCHCVCSCAFEREARFEQRAIDVVNAPSRRVPVNFTNAEQELARERSVRELNCRQRPA
jgi:hypothetical protein